MPDPINSLLSPSLSNPFQYMDRLKQLQVQLPPAKSFGYQPPLTKEPPHNGLVSVQAPQAQKPKKAFSRSVDTQQQRAMAQAAYESELKGYESQISQGYPVDPLSRRRTAERYRNEIARLDALDNATLREDYGNRERARRASNAAVGDEMAGQALDESSAAFAKSTPSAPVVKRNPNGTPTTADPYQYGSPSPNRPANLDRGQGPFTPGPPGPSSSPVPPGPPRQSIDSILDGLRQFQGQSTPQPPFVQALKEAVAKSTTGQLGALAAPPQAPEPNEIEGTVNPARVAPTAPVPVAATTPVAARPAPTQADIDTLNNQMKFEELARQPQALDPAFVEQMRNPYTGPQIGAPRPLPQGTPRGAGEQLFESTFGVGGLLGPPMPSDYGAQAPRTQAEADQRGVDQLGAEINTGIHGVLGGIAGAELNANRRPAPGSGMRPAATIEDGPVLRGQTNPRVTLRPLTRVEENEKRAASDRTPPTGAFGRRSIFDPPTPEEQAHTEAMRVYEQTPRGQRERQERTQNTSTRPVITPGEEGTVVDRKIPEVDRGRNHAWNEDALANAVNRSKGRYPTSNRVEQAEQAKREAGSQKWAEDKVKEQGPLNAENENARRQGQNPIREERTRERGRKENEKSLAAYRVQRDAKNAEYEAQLAADQAKATEDLKFAKQDSNSVAEREAQVEFGKAQDRKEAVRVQAAKDKANLEKNPINPITGEKQVDTDADGAPMFTAEQLAQRRGIKGGTPEADPISQALADKQANKKALVEAANKGDMAAVDKLLAEGKAIDARARASEEKSKTVIAKVGTQGASFARDLAGRVALARQRAGLTYDKTAIPLEGTTTRKPAKAAPAPEPEQMGIEVLAKPTTGEPIASTQPTAPSEAKDAKRQRPVDLPAPVEQRAKAVKKDPVVVEATPTDAKKVESTSTPTTPIPVVPEAKAPEAEPKQTPVKPTPRSPVKKAIAAITGQDKKPISTAADKPKTVAPKDETADRVARAKRLRAQTDLIEKKPKGKK